MGFYVGQEVVCIDASNGYKKPVVCPLIKGNIYIVTDSTSPSGHGIKVDGDSIRWWDRSRFRPLTSRPTSISIFTAMLGPKQKETIDG